MSAMSLNSEAEERTTTVFDVRGMDCASCAKTVETAVERLPGVAAASVNFGAATLTVEATANSQVDLMPRVTHAVEMAGYRAISRQGRSVMKAPPIWQDRRFQFALVSLVLWLFGAALSVGFDIPEGAKIAYVGAAAVGLWTFGRPALMAIQNRRLDMNVLMSLAVIGALLLGDWAEAAAAAALFAIGNVAQNLTFDRTRNALASLAQLTPPEASRIRNGQEELVSVEVLEVGDVVRVRPGQRFPIDGFIAEGTSYVDESLITGESVPAEKGVGSTVYAGALNGAGSVTVDVSRTVADSTLVPDRAARRGSARWPWPN